MIPLPKGTFLVFGEAREPRVVTLSEYQFKLFYDCMMFAGMEKSAGGSFGIGFSVAIPAWVEGSLELMEGYTGPHQRAVLAICAAIRLGITFEDLQHGRTGPATKQTAGKPRPGGTQVKRPATAPKSPSPAGQTFSG